MTARIITARTATAVFIVHPHPDSHGLRRAGNRSPLPTPRERRCLRGGDGDAHEGRTNSTKQVVKIGADRLRADRDGEGKEDEKHGIFGSTGTAFIFAITVE